MFTPQVLGRSVVIRRIDLDATPRASRGVRGFLKCPTNVGRCPVFALAAAVYPSILFDTPGHSVAHSPPRV